MLYLIRIRVPLWCDSSWFAAAAAAAAAAGYNEESLVQITLVLAALVRTNGLRLVCTCFRLWVEQIVR